MFLIKQFSGDKIKIKSIIILFFLISSKLLAQGEAAVPFLTMQQSPILVGAGSIGSSIPIRDAVGHYYNPANLGYMAKETNFAMMVIPNNTKLYDVHYLQSRSFGITLGYNFRKTEKDLPFAIGFGYMRGKLSFGNFLITDAYGDIKDEFESYDSFDMYSIGASLNYYLDFNIGVSLKNVFSYANEFYDDYGNLKIAEANKIMFDFGTMIIVPISNLLFGKYNFSIGNTQIFPYTNLTLGYSLANYGGEISYLDEDQSDPLPRTARTGYNFNVGFKIDIKNESFKMLDYSFTAEANDILIKPRDFNSLDELNEIEYQSILGDINYFDHVISLNPDDKVIVHKGHIFNLFETFIITTGSYSGRIYFNRISDGYGFSSEGIFKLLSLTTNSDIFSFFSKHIIIEYYDTNDEIIKGSNNHFAGRNSNYKGFTLYLKNIIL